ncbi:MAG TPA: discoidin domain-containing protein [Ruminiclostridium sp.]
MVKINKGLMLVIVVAMFISLILIPKNSYAADTDWMYNAKWGVWIDYMADDRTDETQPTWTKLTMNSTTWNNMVSNFDVNGLANQLATAKVGFAVLTLGQNSGYICTPNSTYDSLMGYSPARSTTRDLVNDLYNALSPRGIKLMLYIPCAKPGDDYSNPDGWANVIREWSTRYGNKISGWWFDGYYGHTEVTQPLSDAVHAGNPTAAISFNPGIGIQATGRGENYTAGEINEIYANCNGQWINNGSYNEQWSITSFMSNWWGKDGYNDSLGGYIPPELVGKKGPRYSTSFITSRFKNIVDNGGVIQLDVPIRNCGLIWDSYLSQLNAIGTQIYRDTMNNLALNKQVTVSNYYNNDSQYSGAKAVDGNTASRWATSDGTTNCWIEVDLGSNMSINKTRFRQYDYETASGTNTKSIQNYKIQYWDGFNWQDAYSGNNPDYIQQDTFTPVTASKIRLNILSASAAPTIWEFEVYGNSNLALNKTVTVSEYYNNNPQYDGSKAVDENGLTRWATNDATISGWLEVDLGVNTTFNKTVIKQFDVGGQRIKDYKIQYWNGSSWLDAYSGTTPSLDQANTFNSVTGSKVRLNILNINGSMGPSISEFEVYIEHVSQPINLVLNKNATTSDYYNNNPQYDGSKAIDENGLTRWATNDATTSGWLEVNFGINTTFNKTVIKQFDAGGQRIKDYKIQYWNGSSWLDAYSGTTPTLDQANTFNSVTGSKVRLNILNINGSMGPSILEFEVYNN